MSGRFGKYGDLKRKAALRRARIERNRLDRSRQRSQRQRTPAAIKPRSLPRLRVEIEITGANGSE